MHDLPPHPRSPSRLAERLLDEAPPLNAPPPSTAVTRAQAGMRVPLAELARAAQGATERAKMRVSPMVWLVPAVGVGAGVMALNAAPVLAALAAVAAGATLYLIARAVMLRHAPGAADATPQMMEVARCFDALAATAADLPPAAREVFDAVDAALAEVVQAAPLPTDAREIHGAVTRHLPEALATFRAMPPSAHAAGEPLLVSQLTSIRDRLTQVLQSVQSDRLRTSRQLDRFLRDKASR